MKKIPFWCPKCKKIIEPIDYDKIYKFGTCSECFINFIEDRHEDKTEQEISEIIDNLISSKPTSQAL